MEEMYCRETTETGLSNVWNAGTWARIAMKITHNCTVINQTDNWRQTLPLIHWLGKVWSVRIKIFLIITSQTIFRRTATENLDSTYSLDSTVHHNPPGQSCDKEESQERYSRCHQIHPGFHNVIHLQLQWCPFDMLSLYSWSCHVTATKDCVSTGLTCSLMILLNGNIFQVISKLLPNADLVHLLSERQIPPLPLFTNMPCTNQLISLDKSNNLLPFCHSNKLNTPVENYDPKPQENLSIPNSHYTIFLTYAISLY